MLKLAGENSKKKKKGYLHSLKVSPRNVYLWPSGFNICSQVVWYSSLHEVGLNSLPPVYGLELATRSNRIWNRKCSNSTVGKPGRRHTPQAVLVSHAEETSPLCYFPPRSMTWVKSRKHSRLTQTVEHSTIKQARTLQKFPGQRQRKTKWMSEIWGDWRHNN